MKLQTVFALEAFATNLTRHCGVLTHPLIVGLCPMIFVTGFRSTKVTTVITPLGEHCMVVESVVFQCIWHGELLTTILTGQRFVMIFLHVMLVHAHCVESNITMGTPHDGSILKIKILSKFKMETN